MEEEDFYYMGFALEEAKKAFSANEVPVGAVLVYRGELIARAHNRVEALCDATAHAELLCIKQAALHLENWRLKEAVLYCTLEPCSMCAGAMILSRIDTLVWGAPDYRQGAHGSWTNLLDLSHPIHQIKVRKGIRAEEASQLLTQFFKNKREQKHGCAL